MRISDLEDWVVTPAEIALAGELSIKLDFLACVLKFVLQFFLYTLPVLGWRLSGKATQPPSPNGVTLLHESSAIRPLSREHVMAGPVPIMDVDDSFV